ncbi:hypothetical protein SAMN04488057_11254 [Cyclobacterium lianum]|uniref:Uncharacterized protein n=1 Tax=Cyclobacterium lianum TaxID=388280 RepID=A0A1M7PZD1_9BACT|nr:hypothetical protein [Cyclobacterium lianum]SHN23057.1 hypothetical protein SAMN04488057_11254 [Cyclobacterium lianum]
MLYIIPTKRGIGIELWGAYGDLNNFYEVIGKFWNDEKASEKLGFENRDKLISNFSFEIRKAKDNSRLKRENNHLYPFEEGKYLGTQFSWVHFLFSISALKYNMQFYETNKFDISVILQIEFWLEKAMNSYDETGARNLIPFINDGLHGANEYIYQCMRTTNLEYFLLGGGKKAFRKLPELLKRGIFYTEESMLLS